MALDRPIRRLPLRDLMTDAEKKSRALEEHILNTYLAHTGDLHELSRPLRKKSHYPTLLAIQNSLERVLRTSEETERLVEILTQELDEIREHARRERLNRR